MDDLLSSDFTFFLLSYESEIILYRSTFRNADFIPENSNLHQRL